MRAERVVANTDMRLALDRLLPADAVDPSYRRWIDGLRPSFPCFLSHLGVRGLPADVLQAAQGYYWNDWDAEEVGRDGLCCKIFVPTLYEPRLAPPGGHVIILQKVQALDYAAVDDWPTHKAAVESYVFAHLERVIPGIARHVEVRTSASAHTSWRFTLNASGAMLGWEMAPDQLGAARPDIASPIQGLYWVGHWTRPGGGITPVIVSAMRVAEALTGHRALGSRSAERSESDGGRRRPVASP